MGAPRIARVGLFSVALSGGCSVYDREAYQALLDGRTVDASIDVVNDGPGPSDAGIDRVETGAPDIASDIAPMDVRDADVAIDIAPADAPTDTTFVDVPPDVPTPMDTPIAMDVPADVAVAPDGGSDTCAAATPIAIGPSDGTVFVRSTTVGATSDGLGSCFAVGGGRLTDVWYRVAIPVGFDLRAEAGAVAGSTGDPLLLARDSCLTSSTFEACNDNVAAAETTARIWVRTDGTEGPSGRTVYLAVAMRSPGPFELRVSLQANLTTTSCSVGQQFDVTLGGTVLSPLPRGTGATRGTCGPPVSVPEIVYLYRPPRVGGASFGTFAAGVLGAPGVVLYERSSTCDTGTELNCMASTAPSYTLTTNVPAVYLFTESASGTGGTGSVSLRVQRP